MISEPRMIAAGGSHTERFTVFSGPKQPKLLEHYGLERCIEYGIFRPIARILAWVLHFFENLPLVNYGMAIIMLTVLVRSCMIPLSRKATKNAQMMQELAPEMKRISEKYKNDMEKRAAAQKELFAKNNYNPFGGCLLMLVQLPIFIGLYRALSVDVELRQAPLISGIQWCSNLAGPDMIWYWKPYLWARLADETGWLGPYLNVLPLFTIALFLLQQKMFMPPATDDQTRMQQKMMKFMMLFMGVLFFRVPSGLCIYFIASSLWGLAERKLLPPVGKKKSGGGSSDVAGGKKPDSGGSGTSPAKKLASFAEQLSNKLGADANVRTAKSKRRPRKR
jgi:YidC/Oxa1 family membrane protein insertase